MNLIIPVLLILVCTYWAAGVGVWIWDTLSDLLTQPFNPRYVATWMVFLAFEVGLFIALCAIIWFSVLTMGANCG